MNDLAQQVVMITGSVGNLGAAVAREFQLRKARTVLVDRSAERLRATYPDLVSSNDHFLAGDVDVGSAESVGQLVKQVRVRFGRIDVLINTVGAFRGGKPVHEEDPETWTALLDANLRTTLNLCRAVIPVMLEQRKGRIVNVASLLALNGAPNLAAYSVSKAAVVRLTESLSAELRSSGIGVNCVLPGTLDTPQNRRAMPDADPAGWISPDDVAKVMVFLASDAARAIHGASVPLCGTG